MNTQSGQDKRPFSLKLLIIASILLAFGLYLHQLGDQSLWRDEALSLIRANQPVAHIFANRNIVDGVESPDLHPPLYFLLLRGSIALISDSEFGLRMPSVWASVLAIALFYTVGRLVWQQESGGWTVAIALLSPFYFWYAQEARMYAVVRMESLLLLWTLWRVLQKRTRPIHLILFAVSSFVLMLTHYTGLFMVLATTTIFTGYQLRQRIDWRLFALLGLLIVSGLLLLPHVVELVGIGSFFSFSQRPLFTLVQEMINTVSLGSTIPLPDAGWQLLPAVVLGGLGAAAIGVAPRHRRWQAFWIGDGTLLLSLFAFYAASLIIANYSNPRHLTILSIPWFLLMGHGLATVRHWHWLAGVMAFFLIFFTSGAALHQTITAPPMQRDDVRQLTQYIDERLLPGDVVVWHDAPMMTVYDYYVTDDTPYAAIPTYGESQTEQAIQELSDLAAQYERIWFVSSPSPAYFDETALPEWFDNNMTQVDSADFPASWASLYLELYKRPFSSPVADIYTATLQEDGYRIHTIAPELPILDNGVWMAIEWSADTLHENTPSLCLRLLDTNAYEWSAGCTTLSAPSGTDTMVQQMSQSLWLPLPTGLAPIAYQLELVMHGQTERLGEIVFHEDQNFGEERPFHTFKNGINLVDIEWAADQFQAGQWIVGYPIWRIDGALSEPYYLHTRLVDFWGRTQMTDTVLLAASDYPTVAWSPDALTRTLLAMKLPFDLNGRYRLQLAISDRPNQPSDGWYTTDKIQINAWPLETELPNIAQQPSQLIRINDQIELVGYTVVQENETITVDLFWRTDETIVENYGVFVHIGDPNAPPIAQSSNEPVNWSRPTNSWRKGELIHDSHHILLPDGMNGAVSVGMYKIEDSTIRLPLTEGETAVFNSAWVIETEEQE